MLRFTFFFVALLWAAAAGAQIKALGGGQSFRDTPALLTAELMTYDQQLGIVSASGNVEIAQGERVLMADTVSYGEKDGKVIASGNVSLLEANGDVLFADYMELTDEMKNGFVAGVRTLMADNSRMAGQSAVRGDGNRTVLNRAVYSPCNLCAEDPTRAPIWQVRAVRVIHDQDAKTVEYKDATFEAFGVPVAYLPYFSHPDPTVRRQSGFLTPSLSNNNFFGLRTQIPYYWAISDTQDATIDAQISAKQGLAMFGEYRQRVTTGELKLDGSITRVDQADPAGRIDNLKQIRGHIRANGRFRPEDDLRTGFDVFRATDDTYTRRFNVPDGSVNTLTSRLFVEQPRGRNFAALNAYAFQGLRVDDRPGETPIVAPLASYEWFGEPGEHGGRFGFDGSAVSLYRTAGTDTRRLASNLYWQLPYYSPLGDVYTLTANIRTEGYWVSDFTPAGATPTGEEFVGRVRPQVTLDWRYPFVRNDGAVHQVIEPIVSATVSPYGGNLRRIPNEDSQSLELDETNLFAANRFPGIDRVDGGPRISYGARFAAYGARGGFTELLLGQSLRYKEDDTFGEGTGLSGHSSDYVARLVIQPSSFFSLSERVRINQSSLELKRNEVTATVGPPALQLSITYAQIDRNQFTQELQDREAVAASLFARLSKYYSLSLSHLRDLGKDGGSLNSQALLRYTDECIALLFFVVRSDTIDRDIKPSTTFGVRLKLESFG